jgi:hypothetical protein
VQIINKESRRTIGSRLFEPEKTVEAVKPKKKHEDPGYER